jgi:hypothetical protein
LKNIEIQDFCLNMCDKFNDHLTVIKGYMELSEKRNDKTLFVKLRYEIEDASKTIDEFVDEIKRWVRGN